MVSSIRSHHASFYHPTEDRTSPQVSNATRGPRFHDRPHAAHVRGAITSHRTEKPRADDSSAVEESLDAIGKATEQGDLSKVSEQQLYAALTHRSLKEKNPELATRFLDLLHTRLDKMKARHGVGLEAKASDMVLRGMVRDGSISQAEYRSMREEALGRCDLDGERNSISRSGDSTARSDAVTRTATNAGASADEVKAYLANERHSPLPGHRTKGSGDALNSSSVTSVDRPSGGSLSTDLPLPDQKASGSNGFLWKPASDSDGRLVVLLPPSLTGRATKVEVLSPTGDRVLATGRFSGIGNGMRQHYRFSEQGDRFPPNVIVKITLNDGSVGTVRIPQPGSRQE